VFLASAGYRAADLALTIKRFSVRSEAVAIPESMAFKQRVASAVVHRPPLRVATLRSRSVKGI